MTIDTILISEYASADAVGRFSVVNAFNRISGKGPTWGLPIMYLTLVAHGPQREAGMAWDGEIFLLNSAGERVREEPFTFRMAFSDNIDSGPGMPMRSVVGVAFAGLRFTEPGMYVFQVLLDGLYEASTTLWIEKSE
ncbi:MAG: hypothetical protein AAF389_14965 [Gemmatimonadota bacterium]